MYNLVYKYVAFYYTDLLNYCGGLAVRALGVRLREEGSTYMYLGLIPAVSD